jgi:hypothetical protein
MTDARIRGESAVAPTVPGKLNSVCVPHTLAVAAVLMLVIGVDSPVQAQQQVEPERGRLRSAVERLASPEFGGRSGAGGDKTVAYLIDQFRNLNLSPLFDGEYVQPIPGKEPGKVDGRNVGAILRGSDERLRDEWVIVAAHFDHLGVRGGVLYPGADDNASGVAMMLEVARSIVQGQAPPRRSMMFIGFDLEELGLYGSRYFVAHAPVSLDKVVLFVTADMIGRSLAGICPVCALGLPRRPRGGP